MVEIESDWSIQDILKDCNNQNIEPLLKEIKDFQKKTLKVEYSRKTQLLEFFSDVASPDAFNILNNINNERNKINEQTQLLRNQTKEQRKLKASLEGQIQDNIKSVLKLDEAIRNLKKENESLEYKDESEDEIDNLSIKFKDLREDCFGNLDAIIIDDIKSRHNNINNDNISSDDNYELLDEDVIDTILENQNRIINDFELVFDEINSETNNILAIKNNLQKQIKHKKPMVKSNELKLQEYFSNNINNNSTNNKEKENILHSERLFEELTKFYNVHSINLHNNKFMTIDVVVKSIIYEIKIYFKNNNINSVEQVELEVKTNNNNNNNSNNSDDDIIDDLIITKNKNNVPIIEDILSDYFESIAKSRRLSNVSLLNSNNDDKENKQDNLDNEDYNSEDYNFNDLVLIPNCMSLNKLIILILQRLSQFPTRLSHFKYVNNKYGCNIEAQGEYLPINLKFRNLNNSNIEINIVLVLQICCDYPFLQYKNDLIKINNLMISPNNSNNNLYKQMEDLFRDKCKQIENEFINKYQNNLCLFVDNLVEKLTIPGTEFVNV